MSWGSIFYPKHTKEELRLFQQKYRRDNPKSYILGRVKHRAKARGYDFDLEKEDIVIPEVCPYLKTPFVSNSPYAMSLDRIDNSKGYVKGNVEVISWKANIMKSDATTAELLEFAYTILERN